MIAKWFRFKKKDVGIAVGQNLIDLFWIIDEHGDPYDCEVANVTSGGSVLLTDKWEGTYYSEYIPAINSKEWHKQKWPPYFKMVGND